MTLAEAQAWFDIQLRSIGAKTHESTVPVPDMEQTIQSQPAPTPEQIAALKQELHINQPGLTRLPGFQPPGV